MNTNKHHKQPTRGFTLIELLVVIGIIATLGAISFPVYTGIKRKMEKQEFEMIIGNLERAVDNFEIEYNYLPYIGADYPGTDDPALKNQDGDIEDFISMMMGLSSGNANFKQISFFECREAGGDGKNGIVYNANRTSATLHSQWGREYERMMLDYDYSGSVLYPYNQGDPSLAIQGVNMLLWDFGPDGSANSIREDNWHNFPVPWD